jgi:hypothetical protein
VSENRALRRIFRLGRVILIRYWRKLHNEEHHNLYSSSNVVGMIKSRRIREAGNVAWIRNKKSA